MAESIEAYRTRHTTTPGLPDENGTRRCVVDGFRVYPVRGGAWRHDVTLIPNVPAFPTGNARQKA